MAEYRRKKRKVCQLCAGKNVTYKDENIKKYVSLDKGKILPRRITGTCAKHQRYVAGEVKKARIIALLPFVK
ncbi:MAG: 30S ribosomal protein S18 [Bacilli bacterium]|nr:30S ribosomal protein S18 [Bacilli bacterium]MBR3209022.1 30S ribosomal protein S18 [Bacilli bacterium]